jgi:hypothetical protein
MPLVLKYAKHSPENCPFNNEKQKKLDAEVMAHLPELCKKHGVRVVGGWAVMPEHFIVMVYEIPSLEAFQKFQMEPLIMKWVASQSTVKFKLANTLEESMKAVMQ